MSNTIGKKTVHHFPFLCGLPGCWVIFYIHASFSEPKWSSAHLKGVFFVSVKRFLLFKMTLKRMQSVHLPVKIFSNCFCLLPSPNPCVLIVDNRLTWKLFWLFIWEPHILRLQQQLPGIFLQKDDKTTSDTGNFLWTLYRIEFLKKNYKFFK